jgi:hypothetical protein
MHFRVSVSDVRTAFMQSDLEEGARERGTLYARQPPGGARLMDGSRADARCIIRLNTAVYGLVNAPVAWRRSLKRSLESNGYVMSHYDPCLFVMKSSRLHGCVIVEVDDLLSFGDAKHLVAMGEVRKRFNFGKWKEIYGSQADYAGRCIEQKVDYSFFIHQTKFASERLSEVALPTIRRCDPTAVLDATELRRVRGVLGSLNWLQRESRPDISGNVSIMMSRVSKATVNLVKDAHASSVT